MNRLYTVDVEHGDYGGRGVVTRNVKAPTFDSAVKAAKRGLVAPVEMRVSVDLFFPDDEPVQADLFSAPPEAPSKPAKVKRSPYVDGTTVEMTFGEHKGKTLEDTPCEYLHWLCTQEFFQWKHSSLHAKVASYLSDPAVKRELERRLSRA
jgi:hypothetical protein